MRLVNAPKSVMMGNMRQKCDGIFSSPSSRARSFESVVVVYRLVVSERTRRATSDQRARRTFPGEKFFSRHID